MRDGTKVAYVGHKGNHIGDEGIVMQGEVDYSHVKWITGSREGEIDLVRNDDLVVNGSLHHTHLTADFESPLLDGINVEAVHEKRGTLGLLNVLATDGHLSFFAQVGEEALAMVASRVREDPSISEVLARLEQDDAEEFVRVASLVALRDALGGPDGA